MSLHISTIFIYYEHLFEKPVLFILQTLVISRFHCVTDKLQIIDRNSRIQDYQTKWSQCLGRTEQNRIPTLRLQTKRQKRLKMTMWKMENNFEFYSYNFSPWRQNRPSEKPRSMLLMKINVMLQWLKHTYKIMGWGHNKIKLWPAKCHNSSLKNMALDYVLDEWQGR
jgi:hypothetical protein